MSGLNETLPAEAAPARSSTLGWLLLVLRLVLGGIFLFAAVGKLQAPHAFAGSVGAFKILHESVLLEVALVFIWHEILCAVLLILGFWTRAAAALVGALLVVFISAMVSAMVRGLDIDCGCFGALLESGVGWGSIIRTLLLLVMAAVLVIGGGGRLSLANILKK